MEYEFAVGYLLKGKFEDEMIIEIIKDLWKEQVSPNESFNL